MSDESMFHHGEVVDAICLLCTGATALTADASDTAVLQVGSNGLFAVGDQVRVSDRLTAGAEGTVVALSGISGIELEAPVAGPYLVAEGAIVQRLSGDLPDLAWVGRGVLEAGVRAPLRRTPCALVRPMVLDQPLSEGTNRAQTQDYATAVYYARSQAQGEDEETAFLEQVGRLFDVLMRDPYLGGSCWYSQVTHVDLSTPEETVFRAGGSLIRVARLDVVARRSEMTQRG